MLCQKYTCLWGQFILPCLTLVSQPWNTCWAPSAPAKPCQCQHWFAVADSDLEYKPKVSQYLGMKCVSGSHTHPPSEEGKYSLSSPSSLQTYHHPDLTSLDSFHRHVQVTVTVPLNGLTHQANWQVKVQARVPLKLIVLGFDIGSQIDPDGCQRHLYLLSPDYSHCRQWALVSIFRLHRRFSCKTCPWGMSEEQLLQFITHLPTGCAMTRSNTNVGEAALLQALSKPWALASWSPTWDLHMVKQTNAISQIKK